VRLHVRFLRSRISTHVHPYKQIIARERTLKWGLYVAYGSLHKERTVKERVCLIACQVLASRDGVLGICFDKEERGTRLQGDEALVQ
jgi:hypothetical protein